MSSTLPQFVRREIVGREEVAGSPTGSPHTVLVDAQGRLVIGASVASTPELKGRIFNTAVAIATDFFAADLAPTNTPTTFRIHVTLDSGGIVSVQRTSGGVTVAELLNNGIVLTANSAYMFDILVHEDDTINLQDSIGGQILYCMVMEVPGVMA